MTDLSPDFVGRVERLSLRPTAETALTPLFEAVSNALHAVNDRFGQETNAKTVIKVEVLRADLAEEQSPVTGFIVEDNGIGLNEANFRSFCRLDSRHKIGRGGKGIGRLSWLKVFEQIDVNSTYFEGEESSGARSTSDCAEKDQIVDREARDPCPADGGIRVAVRLTPSAFRTSARPTPRRCCSASHNTS